MSNTNYVSYKSSEYSSLQIGHYDLAKNTIQPLSFTSGTPIKSLYQVIEAGEANIRLYDEAIPASSVKILAPITGRDIMAVGKNYFDHAKEFNKSGFDSSDKVDVPTHPVIFTKRATSIIATGETIYPHPDFTTTVDYEGEIGVIVGKAGFRVKEEDAMNFVWGYTIINDMTARERQRDHKQFFIGKSPDTFCPIVSAYSATCERPGLTVYPGSNCSACFSTSKSSRDSNPCERRATSKGHERRPHIFHSDSHQDYIRRSDIATWRRYRHWNGKDLHLVCSCVADHLHSPLE
jgi:hypothetical protein